MIPDLALIPAGAVRFAAGFDRWWAAVRPSDAELLDDRRANLVQLKAMGGEVSIDAAQALEALALADEPRKAQLAVAAAMAAQADARTAFLGILGRGDIAARILIGNHERAIAPNWWLEVSFDMARRHRPSIYFDGGEYSTWLQAATKPVTASFKDLVAFLARRLPPAPAPAPKEADDIAATHHRFGDQFGRDLIREARKVAHGDRKRGRGKSAT